MKSIIFVDDNYDFPEGHLLAGKSQDFLENLEKIAAPWIQGDKKDLISKHVEYEKKMGLLKKSFVRVSNVGSTIASRCSVVLTFSDNGNEFFVLGMDEIPDPPPSIQNGILVSFHKVLNGVHPIRNGGVCILKDRDKIEVRLPIGSIQSGDHKDSPHFYFGSVVDQNVTCRYRILFDEPGGPLVGDLDLHFVVHNIELKSSDIPLKG